MELKFLCIGGGTPTVLNIKELDQLFHILRNNFVITKNTRIAVESSPNTLDLGKLSFLKKSGVEWLAIGVQSFNDGLLKTFNRCQNKKQVLGVIEQAKKAGINNIEVDLIIGLPGQTDKSFMNDIDIVSKLDLERVFMFDLQPRFYTGFDESDKSGSVAEIENYRALRRRAVDILVGRGYLMAHGGHWVYKRNGIGWPASYDQGEDGSYSILGLGPSAISYAMGKLRSVNVPSLEKYVAQLNHGQLPVKKGCILSERDEMINFIMLDAFQRGEIGEKGFKQRFGMTVSNVFKSELSNLVKNGILMRTRQSYMLRNRARAVFEIKKEIYDKKLITTLARVYGIGNPGISSTPTTTPPVVSSPLFNRLGKNTYECHIYNKCNLNCRFCFNNEVNPVKSVKNLSLELFNVRESGVKKVIFAGSEPTLFEGLPNVIRISKKLKFSEVAVCTNGIRTSDPGYCGYLKKCGLNSVYLTVLSHIPEVQNYLANSESFNHVVASAGNFQKLGVPVTCVNLLNKKNIHGIEGYLRYFRHLGVNSFTLVFPRFLGKMKNQPELAIQHREIKIKPIINLAEKLNINLKFLNMPLHALHPYIDYALDSLTDTDPASDTRESNVSSEAIKSRCAGCKYLLKCLGMTSDYMAKFGFASRP
jgi:oxygen-independent coproporphyrinogen-3 oxidase